MPYKQYLLLQILIMHAFYENIANLPIIGHIGDITNIEELMLLENVFNDFLINTIKNDESIFDTFYEQLLTIMDTRDAILAQLCKVQINNDLLKIKKSVRLDQLCLMDKSNINLSNIDLSNIDLSNIDLSNIDLSNIDLSNCADVFAFAINVVYVFYAQSGKTFITNM